MQHLTRYPARIRVPKVGANIEYTAGIEGVLQGQCGSLLRRLIKDRVAQAIVKNALEPE